MSGRRWLLSRLPWAPVAGAAAVKAAAVSQVPGNPYSLYAVANGVGRIFSLPQNTLTVNEAGARLGNLVFPRSGHYLVKSPLRIDSPDPAAELAKLVRLH